MQCRFLQQLFVVSSVLSIFFGSAGSGRAQLIFDFTYSDTAGNTAQGTLTAVNSGLGDGSLWATSGMLTVLTSPGGAALVGTYTLLPAGPHVGISPSGLFEIDNLIYPANDAASGVNTHIGANPSYLTYWGLLFGHPGTGLQDEINIWGNGGGDYAFYSEQGGSYIIQQGSGGSFTLTAVPEPSSLVLTGIAALGMGVYVWRRRKKSGLPIAQNQQAR